jgi:hypothetical protein
MSEIRNWLEGIGLGQHADAFEANIASSGKLAKTNPRRRQRSATAL